MPHEMPPVFDERVCFERAVLPLTRALRSAALHLSRNAADADDLVQETVLRAWRFWPRYQERASCRAWLHRILRNAFVSRARQRARERQMLLSAGHQSLLEEHVEGVPVQGGLDDAMAQSLATLREDQRRVLLLVDVERCSYQQAASALGVPIGTVMSRLHRARSALRRGLAGSAPTGASCCA